MNVADPILWIGVAGVVLFAWASGFAAMSMGTIRRSHWIHGVLTLLVLSSIGVCIWRGGWWGATTILLAYLVLRQGGFSAMRGYQRSTGRLHPDADISEKKRVFAAEYLNAKQRGQSDLEAQVIAQSMSGYFGASENGIPTTEPVATPTQAEVAAFLDKYQELRHEGRPMHIALVTARAMTGYNGPMNVPGFPAELRDFARRAGKP
jgi:hypothetical protein